LPVAFAVGISPQPAGRVGKRRRSASRPEPEGHVPSVSAHRLVSAMVQKARTSPVPPPRQVTERACNDPQRMRARKTEAEIMEKMPSRAWLSCTAVSRLIRALDTRKTRARLDRLVRDGKI